MVKKMSEIIIEFAGDYIKLGNNIQERQSYLNTACSAWNVSFLNERERKEWINKYFEEMKMMNLNESIENINGVIENLEKLIELKIKLFPDMKKRIINGTIEIINGQECIGVSSKN